MTDEKQSENAEPKQEEKSVESPAKANEQETGAGAAQEPSNDYGTILEILKQVQDNQARLVGEIAAIKDAQSVMVDAGAVIHDDSEQIDLTTGVDEFVPIDKLDLSI